MNYEIYKLDFPKTELLKKPNPDKFIPQIEYVDYDYDEDIEFGKKKDHYYQRILRGRFHR